MAGRPGGRCADSRAGSLPPQRYFDTRIINRQYPPRNLSTIWYRDAPRTATGCTSHSICRRPTTRPIGRGSIGSSANSPKRRDVKDRRDPSRGSCASAGRLARTIMVSRPLRRLDVAFDLGQCDGDWRGRLIRQGTFGCRNRQVQGGGGSRRPIEVGPLRCAAATRRRKRDNS